ncbi:MAG: hypothetical protein NE328_11615 [Lentisphaeraceae bacterium]|nr:hypothetical protein [Lentisphaeraceae bacterium]
MAVMFLPMYLWDKIFPSKNEYNEIVYPKLDLPKLGTWGQSYDLIYNAYCFQDDFNKLKPIPVISLKSFPVDIEEEKEISDLLLNQEVSEKIKARVEDCLSNWIIIESEINRETREFYLKKYIDPNVDKNEELLNFITKNYFKIKRLIVRKNSLVLDCENAFDEEHGLAIEISEQKVKVNTADLI